VPSHFIERHGAVIIVALGETIIALPAFNGVFQTCRARVAPSVFRPLTP
jgi:low temperature requirement protein LtrA